MVDLHLRRKAASDRVLDDPCNSLWNTAVRFAELLNDIDDVLAVDFISVKDGDYRQALADLVQTNILQHDDPAVSETARKRRDIMAAYEQTFRDYGNVVSRAMQYVSQHRVGSSCAAIQSVIEDAERLRAENEELRREIAGRRQGVQKGDVW